MNLTGFWAQIDDQLKRLRTATTGADVLRILNDEQYDDVWHEINRNGERTFKGGRAFFAGSGGDETPRASLIEAGWTSLWYEAHYHYALRAPNGDSLEYVEGDVYITPASERAPRPLPHNEEV